LNVSIAGFSSMNAAYITIFVDVVHQRASFVAMIALVVGAGIPLAFAWARALPDDAPAFHIEPGSFPSVDLEPLAPVKKTKRDVISVALALCVTITFLVRFPGMPVATTIHWLDTLTSAATANSIVSTGRIILLLGTGLAACVAAVRPGRMRVPLIAAAGLTLLLWLLGPILQAAMVAAT
jgi:hypothetical protein